MEYSMKLRSLLVMLTLAAVTVSVAVAAPPPGKGKPPAPGQENGGTTATLGKGKPSTTVVACRPRVAIVLKGTLSSAPTVSDTSIAVNVTSSNHHGASYAKASQPTAILVDSRTVVRRQGKKRLTDLVAGDRVLVQARVCKADLADGGVPQLTATRIVAHPASL